MDLARSAELATAFGLRGLAVTEHSGQLYFNRDDYWSGRCCQVGLAGAVAAENRMSAYLEAFAPVMGPQLVAGLEVDSDQIGHPLLRAADRDQVQILVGGIHYVSELARPTPRLDRAVDEYLAIQQRLVESGIAILAHPFRVFARARQPVPASLFAPTIRLLREHGVAAEINFHTNTPQPEFFTQCLAASVPLTFGSDAHNLYEIGEFAPHLQFLREIGGSPEALDGFRRLRPR